MPSIFVELILDFVFLIHVIFHVYQTHNHAEINPLFRHNKGSLAAARTENPERASSGSQFYICHTAIPTLDGQYTVFGETVKGLDIVDKIAAVPTGMNDRPNAPVKIVSMKHINAPKTEAKGK